MHFVHGNVRDASCAWLEAVKNHSLLSKGKGTTLWYMDSGVATENQPYARLNQNMYLRTPVFDKVAFHNLARAFEECGKDEAGRRQ